MSHLFSPLKMRGLQLKNRVVVSPMWQYAAQGGMPTDWHLMHYGRFAEGGAGLVIQEGTNIEPRGRGTMGDLGIWDDSFVPDLTRIVDLVKRNGAAAGIQLMHAGAKAREHRPWEAFAALTDEEISDMEPHLWERLSPSGHALGTAAPGGPQPREMTLDDISEVQRAFVEGARRADACGYDVVELHAAHGYLIHTFLSEYTNKRTDQYGGSFENRCRFLIEIVEGVRRVWPENKPLFVRLSTLDGSSWSIDDTVALAKKLKAAGVDLIDCSMGGITKMVNLGGMGTDRRGRYAYQAEYAGQIRREAEIMTQAVGLIVHAHHAEAIIERGIADTVAVGREMLYNPNWAIDAARKLGADPGYASLPERQKFWLHYREMGMEGFRPSTHDLESVPPV
ncbi:NADH:flavin oxidoreductase/NADH oxidase [Streptomyces sp. NPDC002920]